MQTKNPLLRLLLDRKLGLVSADEDEFDSTGLLWVWSNAATSDLVTVSGTIVDNSGKRIQVPETIFEILRN